MFKRRAEIRERLLGTIEKLRQKCALIPERVMNVEELELLADFKKRMKRRLGQYSIFIEVNNKYYLSEK